MSTEMTIEERIRAGAERLFGGCNFNALFDSEAERYIRHARAALMGAFPELFDGTAWLAPAEPFPGMLAAGCRAAVDDLEPTEAEMQIFYVAMRDAASSRPESGGTP